MAAELVIFDCDGVLVDSELLSVEADIECFGEYGIELSAEEIVERYTGISLAAMLADLEVRFGRALPGFAARHQALLRPLFDARLRPIPGVAAALDSLGARRCVASSGTPERVRHALAVTGLLERFEPDLFSAAMVARGKPAPDLFLHAANRMGAAPRRCVVIEDSRPGIAAAIAAGMTAIGFTGGGHCRPEDAARLREAGAALVIAGMAELPAALARVAP
ncbi:MAG TPA: HAD family hydrolase [Stellaceae bacterium]|nr:HAD family hydrolase [Stellaceae bacterium]